MKIGLLSDTHSHIDKGFLDFFKDCNEIWHAGDIGNIDILDTLQNFKKIRAVYGNIDNHIIRKEIKEYLFIKIEKILILIIHIAGSPPYYNKKTYELIKKYRPNTLICGHSHILKIHRDKKNNILIINPGAAGKIGFHKVKTAIRFEIINSKITNLEIIEIKRN
tara:strand:+ start:156 stop:647 length:492 start_codon:yes stop_codon:yes gene_type:complete